MDYEYLVDGEIKNIVIDKKEGSFILKDGQEEVEVDIRPVSPNCFSVLGDGKSYLIYLVKDGNTTHVSIAGHQFGIQDPADEEKGFKRRDESAEDLLFVKAPMPGKVIKINVSENQEIRKNQTLAIVEAMKMENEIKASMDGFVKKIYASEGDLVDSENPLFELEPISEETD